ncbi:ribonuclease H-like domain-containing protein [Tanacetum coccineum]
MLGPDGPPVDEPALYRSLTGSLQYLTFTRPELSYVVQQLCLFMHDPREPHLVALKRVLRYVRGITDLGLQFDNLLSWSSKRQHTLSRSSAEAEYRGVTNVIAETAWIRNLLRELQAPLFTATLVYCDNVSAVYMSANPVQHQRTKHIEIDIHFVRDKVATGHVFYVNVLNSVPALLELLSSALVTLPLSFFLYPFTTSESIDTNESIQPMVLSKAF